MRIENEECAIFEEINDIWHIDNWFFVSILNINDLINEDFFINFCSKLRDLKKNVLDQSLSID